MIELALIAFHAETLLVVVAATNFTVVAGCRGVAGGVLDYIIKLNLQFWRSISYRRKTPL